MIHQPGGFDIGPRQRANVDNQQVKRLGIGRKPIQERRFALSALRRKTRSASWSNSPSRRFRSVPEYSPLAALVRRGPVVVFTVVAAAVSWPAGHNVKAGSSGLTASHHNGGTNTVTRSHWLMNIHRTSSTKNGADHIPVNKAGDRVPDISGAEAGKLRTLAENAFRPR